MEIIIITLFGFFVGYHTPITSVHQGCVKGDKSYCDVDKKINPYIDKK